MVDLVVLQSVSYVAAAIGVCVAAVYYALNLRETMRNRRITLTNTLMQPLMSEEGNRRFIDMISMEWKDFDDFMKRYDSRVNPENYSKRMALWSLCESLGYLYRANLIDIDTLFGVTNGVIQYIWIKFKPIIYEYRKTEFGPRAFENFEYLAEELNKIQAKFDASDSEKRLERVISEHTRSL